MSRRFMSGSGHPGPCAHVIGAAAIPLTPDAPARWRHRGFVPRPDSSTAETASLFDHLVGADGHATAAPPLYDRPRSRALMLFGRRPPERTDGLGIPASKSLAQNQTCDDDPLSGRLIGLGDGGRLLHGRNTLRPRH
jgi:hypothetical protein